MLECIVVLEGQDLALFVEAEEHAGALEAAEEVRAIQKDPALAGVACAGDALKKNVAEIEALCGAAVAEQLAPAQVAYILAQGGLARNGEEIRKRFGEVAARRSNTTQFSYCSAIV